MSEPALPGDHAERMERASLALDGLSVGDAFGERFFGAPDTAEARIAARAVPAAPWPYTDDTEMALGVMEVLRSHGRIDQGRLAAVFARRYGARPDRGYGGTAHQILRDIGEGAPWRAVSSAVFSGMGSMGNGGAMRAAPVGAYWADDRATLIREARASAEVTHAHPDGQAGAVAVALAAAWAWEHRAQLPGDARRELLGLVVEHTPDGETRTGLAKALALPEHASVTLAVSALGNGHKVIASDTVPFALWCAARHLGDFVEAMWTTVSGLGDRDTTCAIAGGVVALAAGHASIPEAWLQSRESLQLAG
ncbi:MAG TPA: ADP-ribosylglycohydrolase family protein [Kofleriaceae bacterium]|nr:ADP-ribosylglycohydrolase family protein [Kofleriaceae bacterium]